MNQKFEVAIIGGGIIGCSIAYYLAKEKMNVALFESNQIGSKSTSAAAGMLGAHSECDGDFDVFFPFNCKGKNDASDGYRYENRFILGWIASANI